MTTSHQTKLDPTPKKSNGKHMHAASPAQQRRYRARRVHVPPNAPARPPLVRLGTARIGTTLHTLKLVGNLSMARYEYTARDVQAMKDTILRQVEETFSKFRIN